jgi:hypothetical protein
MCGLQKYTRSHGRTGTEIIFANGGSEVIEGIAEEIRDALVELSTMGEP